MTSTPADQSGEVEARIRLGELFYHADGFTNSLDSLSEAPVWIATALNEAHSGDCTKEPWSCMRCHAEDMMAIANYVADRWPADLQHRRDKR